MQCSQVQEQWSASTSLVTSCLRPVRCGGEWAIPSIASAWVIHDPLAESPIKPFQTFYWTNISKIPFLIGYKYT
jgi:hypothetical protein